MHTLEIFNITLKESVDRVLILVKGWIFNALGVVGDDAGVFCVNKFNETVDEVSKVGEQLGIVLCDKIFPDKLGITSLWTRREKIVAPNLVVEC